MLIDLTGDTVTPQTLLSGSKAHDRSGNVIDGECTFDADTSDANALPSEVLDKKTYYKNGSKETGTMPNNGAVAGEITTKTGQYTVPQGYHDGSGKVGISASEQLKIKPENIKAGITILSVEGSYTGGQVKAESKEVTPSGSQQIVQPSAGFDYLSAVTVKAIPYVETANAYGTTVTIG